MRPTARRDRLVVREIGDETIVYDVERHLAHCLDRTAGSVFRYCDGTRTVEEIATLLGGDADPPAREALVSLALEQLSSARLLVDHEEPVAGQERRIPSAESDPGGSSRRELLRLGALALPVIASIVAPTPAQAASACINGSVCGTFMHPGEQCAPLDDGDCTTGFPSSCCQSTGLCEPPCL